MESDIQAHYNSDNLTQSIAAAFTAAGKDPESLATKDLSIIDQLHTGGAKASIRLLEKTDLTAGAHVLDAGCGIGGASRLMAEKFECRVTGIDLAERFIDTAIFLTNASGLDNRVQFHQGSVLEMPFESASFDAVLSQHMLMNIEDKTTVVREFSRVLKPGGTLILHEIFKGNDQALAYPVPWAASPKISFLETWATMSRFLEETGFHPVIIQDESTFSGKWWKKASSAVEQHRGWKSPLNPSLIFGDNARVFGHNMHHNFASGSISLIEAILKKR